MVETKKTFKLKNKSLIYKNNLPNIEVSDFKVKRPLFKLISKTLQIIQILNNVSIEPTKLDSARSIFKNLVKETAHKNQLELQTSNKTGIQLQQPEEIKLFQSNMQIPSLVPPDKNLGQQSKLQHQKLQVQFLNEPCQRNQTNHQLKWEKIQNIQHSLIKPQLKQADHELKEQLLLSAQPKKQLMNLNSQLFHSQEQLQQLLPPNSQYSQAKMLNQQQTNSFVQNPKSRKITKEEKNHENDFKKSSQENCETANEKLELTMIQEKLEIEKISHETPLKTFEVIQMRKAFSTDGTIMPSLTLQPQIEFAMKEETQEISGFAINPKTHHFFQHETVEKSCKIYEFRI